jgi:hypothetical protein
MEERIERGDNYPLRTRLWLDQTHSDELFSPHLQRCLATDFRDSRWLTRGAAHLRAMAIRPAAKSGQKEKKARSIAPCLSVSVIAFLLSRSSDR